MLQNRRRANFMLALDLQLKLYAFVAINIPFTQL